MNGKKAIVKSIMKKRTKDLFSYKKLRPVSNLQFLSKITERAVFVYHTRRHSEWCKDECISTGNHRAFRVFLWLFQTSIFTGDDLLLLLLGAFLVLYLLLFRSPIRDCVSWRYWVSRWWPIRTCVVSRLFISVIWQCTDIPTGGSIEGAYDANTQGLQTELNNAIELSRESVNSSSPAPARRRRRRAVTVPLEFKGVPNPTVCLTHGSLMMWKVQNSDYPKYDKTSLFNTNPTFDDGPFQELEERHQLESTRFELFAYKFDQEGVYVFQSSQKPENRMVSGVNPCWLICPKKSCNLGMLVECRGTFRWRFATASKSDSRSLIKYVMVGSDFYSLRKLFLLFILK